MATHLPRRPLRRAPVVLELDLTAPPVETAGDDPVGRLRTRGRARLRESLRALHEAGSDPAVRGLVARLGGPLPWTVAQDLHAGVRAFARSGRPTLAWAESLGAGGNATTTLALAAAFDEVWLQPTGEVGLLGVAVETTFLRGALDRLGVEPALQQRHEYKNAADRVMRTELTPAHREALTAVTASLWEWAVDAIAAGRSLPPAQVRTLAAAAPFTGAAALAAGLVDRLGYHDEALAAAAADAGTAALLYADRWTPRPRPAAALRRRRGVVALVEARGEIVSGRSRRGLRGPQLGADTVVGALRAAREDDAVKAVVVRVDSPGGSAVASDTIWREVGRVRAAGRPVVVSMGAVAGSGGYYIACPADVIVARPGTLTGSIGVFGGKVVVAELLERVGLGTGTVEQGGGRVTMFSPRRRFDDDQAARLAELLDGIYADFVGKVAAGRGMDRDRVEEVARGRVWTGADALTRGLVDRLGGLRDAVAVARERAGLPPDAPVRPAVTLSPLARVGRPRNSQDPRAARAAGGWSLPGGPDAGAALLTALGLPPQGVLTMPAWRVV